MKTTQYKKEYCEMLVDHMSKGYSFESFGAEVGNGRKTLYDWLEKFPEFKEAKEEGEEKALKFFETIAICHLRGTEIKGIDIKRADKAMCMFFLKTRSKGLYVERVLLSQDDQELEFV